MDRHRVNRNIENNTREDDMRAEYDFSKGKRNRYAGRFSTGVTVVVLDPDVAELFPDSGSVNQALRGLAQNARRPGKKATSRRRTARQGK
jgi:hypothetical protein